MKVRLQEERLFGGTDSDAVRVGNTVRRRPPENAQFVADLLRFFAHFRWPGAPRFIGVDDDGRQILDYVEGYVAWERTQPPAVHSRASLARTAVLLRQLHDLTAGSWLAAGGEVVCHRDLAPANTVYRDGGAGLRPVVFLDWDNAGPGSRLEDLAQLCWRFADLGPHRSIGGAAQLVRTVAAAYRLDKPERLVDALLDYQDQVDEALNNDDEDSEPAEPAHTVAAEVRAARDWLAEHRDALASRLDQAEQPEQPEQPPET